MNSNEEAIYLDDFKEKVSDGAVSFLITDAKYDMIKTKKNEDVQIIKLTVEVQELDNPAGDKEVKNINLFVNKTPRGSFHRFVKAVLEVVRTNAFTPSLLFGLKGKAMLSHYTPEGSEFAYPQMNDWVFYATSDEVSEALEDYLDDGLDDLDF
ncbi:hypothetical protein AB4Y30_13970 [Ornithinibacillus sp. 4-3]|uniref:Uncharacterized protein n=1 Tax=Ornithinibacillus sp. 4-3 TaxID=3231488 RepID=A0AB39HNZ7_9BACI